MLAVTGLLLVTESSKKPTLRTADLDIAAGRVPRVERQAKPIKVAGRSASNRQRNFLMPKLKSLESPGRNLKSFFHDQAELLSDHPAGNASRQKLGSMKRPKSKAAAAKSDQRTRWNRPKTTSVTEVVHQPERSGCEKKDDAATPCKDADAKSHPLGIDKNCHPEDSKAQLNHAAVGIENELLCDELESSVPHKGKKGKHHSTIEPEKKLQNNVPLSDPICCFTSDDEEMTHAPTRKVKRPFGEVNLDWKAGEHGSLEDQKRRSVGPPRLQKLAPEMPMQEKEKGTSLDAARLRASADADPFNDSDVKEGACQGIKGNKSQLLLDGQQIRGDQNETCKQAQTNGAYGVISLFDGVSSVVPALIKKLGYAPAVAIRAENDIDVRAVVCAEFGYRADEQWSFTSQSTAALYVKDVHSLIANNCQVLRGTIEAHPELKWIIVGGSPCQDLTFAGPHKGLLGLAGPCSRLFFVFLCIIFTVQQLCGPSAVRFVAENAASMLEMHYKAFCRSQKHCSATFVVTASIPI